MLTGNANLPPSTTVWWVLTSHNNCMSELVWWENL